MGAAKHTRTCPWWFEPYLQLIQACTTQLDQADTTEKGLFKIASTSAWIPQLERKQQEKNRLEKNYMYFTTNQLSLISFVAVAFKQIFLHLVKDQLSIKTSVRQFAEDSRPASRYTIQQTGLSSFPL